MRKESTPLADCYIIETQVFTDDRGHFYESYHQQKFCDLINRKDINFVQDNQSKSKHGVLRGLHYQTKNTQGKLVRVISGEIYDVVVDLRLTSSSFKKWFGLHLSAENKKMLWVPEGFAHGFLVLSTEAEVCYKTTDYYNPQVEVCLKWNDPLLNISWPKTDGPFLSPKDQTGFSISNCELF